MARVAILIDGDNISASHSARVASLGATAGRVDLSRAYANATNGSGWTAVPGVRFMHAGTGKNAADLLLSIDAIELALTEPYETFVIASSDGDFAHLATRLRELGRTVIGAGEDKTPAPFRAACTRFACLSAPGAAGSAPPGEAATEPATPAPGAVSVTDLDRTIKAVIAENSMQGKGMPLCDLNGKLRARTHIRISERPERTWRGYLASRTALYDVDPRGTDAFVRFKPAGFSA